MKFPHTRQVDPFEVVSKIGMFCLAVILGLSLVMLWSLTDEPRPTTAPPGVLTGDRCVAP
jgi:hypothetical protein